MAYSIWLHELAKVATWERISLVWDVGGNETNLISNTISGEWDSKQNL